MIDDTPGNAALSRELRLFRERQRGDILRVVASYRCPREDCPVGQVKIGVVEEPGRRRFQGPNLCPRCRQKMGYVGLEATR